MVFWYLLADRGRWSLWRLLSGIYLLTRETDTLKMVVWYLFADRRRWSLWRWLSGIYLLTRDTVNLEMVVWYLFADQGDGHSEDGLLVPVC